VSWKSIECASLTSLRVVIFLLSFVLLRDEQGIDSKARKVVRGNNFTQQTNALDVDKHMSVRKLDPPLSSSEFSHF
jgi:hypothetical protein